MWFLTATTLVGCEPAEPPAAPAEPPAAPAEPLAAPEPAPAPVPEPPPPPPPIDPGTLDQTRDRPTADDPALLARLQALVDAVDDPDPGGARAAFFPKSAYVRLKELPKPMRADRDYDERLLAAYDRDVAALRDRIGGGRVVRLEVPEKGVRWIEPGVEYNGIGYWRVKQAKLVVDRGGAEVVTPVTSLISWRGQWYVVHLSGM